MIEDVVRELRGVRFRYADEDQLQEGIAALLAAVGISARREVVLGARDRIDLLTDDGVGIEVKVAGKDANVTAQLRRYAGHDAIRGLVLVTTRARHRPPPELLGKPVHLVSLVSAL